MPPRISYAVADILYLSSCAMDFVCLGLTTAFFLLTLGLLWLCAQLRA